MPKMDYLSNFLSKNIYNDVLRINVSKVTALNVFQILNVISCLNRLISDGEDTQHNETSSDGLMTTLSD